MGALSNLRISNMILNDLELRRTRRGASHTVPYTRHLSSTRRVAVRLRARCWQPTARACPTTPNLCVCVCVCRERLAPKPIGSRRVSIVCTCEESTIGPELPLATALGGRLHLGRSARNHLADAILLLLLGLLGGGLASVVLDFGVGLGAQQLDHNVDTPSPCRIVQRRAPILRPEERTGRADSMALRARVSRRPRASCSACEGESLRRGLTRPAWQQGRRVPSPAR